MLKNIAGEYESRGFRGILPSFSLRKCTREAVRSLLAFVKLVEEAAAHTSLEIYPRCHIATEDVEALRCLLARIRPLCVLVSVELSSRSVAAFSCRDRRVDLLTIIPGVSPRILRGDAMYAAERSKFFEITLSHLLGASAREVAQRLAFCRPYVEFLARKELPLLVSTGPRIEFLAASYRALLAFAKEVLGYPADFAARAMGPLLKAKIQENVEKIAGLRPREGVYIEQA